MCSHLVTTTIGRELREVISKRDCGALHSFDLAAHHRESKHESFGERTSDASELERELTSTSSGDLGSCSLLPFQVHAVMNTVFRPHRIVAET